MIALIIPSEINGTSKLPVCIIKSVTPYSLLSSTRVYSGISKNTNTLELKVPIAKMAVFEINFLYLSTSLPLT